MISRFFIDRPVFASVISLFIVIVGLVIVNRLPIDRYPDITPPTVRVQARYLGASAEVVEQTIAAPIEQQINGVENMLYFESKCTNDGGFVLTATFEVGTDLDIAAVQVQNRVALAEPQLPEEVRRNGISVRKQSTSLLMVLTMESPGGSYDQLFLSNYTKINVRDALARIYGVGDVGIPGEREYGMRVWMRPDSLFKLGLTTADVANAIREQNIQAAAGRIGQAPSPVGQEVEYTVRTEGRLKDPEQFGNIIIRAKEDGSTVRIKDIARVELGAFDYSVFTRFNGRDATNMLIYQLPGSNAVDVADKVIAEMDRLQKTFPNDVRYRLVYDSTAFIRASVKEVLETLIEAVILVIIVVFVFLQSWRATLIPLITVPVSLIGTFILFPPLGFTVNVLTLFGLVLAIGIVVDDAIVVVEAVEQYMERGLPPREAAIKAMEDVSGAVVAIALILIAVFVPVAFLSGITGQLYRQFALTIAISVAISAINALTLSPPLCALLLKPRHGPPTGLLGPFFRGFNYLFERTTSSYGATVRLLLRRSALVAIPLLLLFFGISGLYRVTPSGFLPTEDEGYFIVDVNLPNAASLERTNQVMRQVEEIVKNQPGVKDAFSLGGSSFVTGDLSSSVGTLIGIMHPWEERKKKEESTPSVVQTLQRKLFGLPGAFILVFNPPPIRGLGNTGGFAMKLQDRTGADVETLARITNQFVAAARKDPTFGQVVSTLQANEPQVRLDVDRERARTMGIPVSDIYQTMQTYLGGLYINDFNLFGRTYRVVAEAESEFRRDPSDINRFYVRSNDGKMVPLSILVKTDPTNGPLSLGRYNMFRAADILGGPAPGYSSGQAMAALEKLAATNLPRGFGIEFTGMSYQEKKTGSSVGVFAFSLLMVLLFLSAQYESWIIPFAVIFAVPAGVFGAIFTEWWLGIPDDVYCRVGLIMLIGLAAKNAILIVEFARQRRQEGRSIDEAALDAAQLRYRPILMTSFAFILGVLPLVISTGAGASARRSLGSAVFGGMIAATMFGVVSVPVFFKWMELVAERIFRKRIPTPVFTATMIALMFVVGCKVGPNYKRPMVPTPPAFRNAEPSEKSMADTRWVQLFQDETLHKLTEEALQKNYDLRIAAQRIIEARSAVTGARADQLPTVNASASLTDRELSGVGATPVPPTVSREISAGRAGLDLAFQLDFWGKYRRLSEAARADLLGQEWARRAIQVTLVSDVSTLYFQIIELDRELDISRKTLALREQSLKLVQARKFRGVASGLDVAQAESLVSGARLRIPIIERALQQTENALSVLLARDPGVIADRKSLASQATPPEIPAGLPSALLARRPDLQQAEQNLVAANARIGVAKANLLPSFSLTGQWGHESFALSRFAESIAQNYSLGPALSLPVFNAGRLNAQVKAAQARYETASLQYEQAFRNALRDTADSLILLRTVREQRTAQESLVGSLREANRLSGLRYQGGVDSYLQVLDSERNLFEAELSLSQVQRDELLAVVRLYRSLGGGWE